MEDNIQLFEHEEFGEVRVVMIDGEPWFVAADVCRILELGNSSQAVSRLDDDEKRKITESRVVVDPHFNIGSDSREINVVNEPGLYRLVFASRKKEAREFQRWVYHEVLPSIRKTGSYSVNKNTTDPLALEGERLALERDKLALEREQFNVENSEETKNFKKAQLLRELASAARDFYLRDSLVNYSAKLITGKNFIEGMLNTDEDAIVLKAPHTGR